MLTKLQMGYSTREALHHVLLTQIQHWRIGNRYYMKFPQEAVQE
jgi:hypothetical protein